MIKKHNIIGEQAWHVFEKDGVEVKEECTIEEYGSLSLSNPVNPTKKDHAWKFSYKDWKYDTVSGRLEDNCYVEFDGKAIYKVPNEKQKTLEIEKFNSVINK